MKTIKRTMLALITALALLTFTACSDREVSNDSSAPPSSQSEQAPPPSAPQSQPEPSEEPAVPETYGQFTEFAAELRYEDSDELVDVLNELLESHRDGTFEEVENHHPLYPSDFPPVSNLPVIESLDSVAILWREPVQIDVNTVTEGGIYVVVPIDDAHIYILEPARFSEDDSNFTLGFGSSGYAFISVEDFMAQSETQTWPDAFPHVRVNPDMGELTPELEEDLSTPDTTDTAVKDCVLLLNQTLTGEQHGGIYRAVDYNGSGLAIHGGADKAEPYVLVWVINKAAIDSAIASYTGEAAEIVFVDAKYSLNQLNAIMSELQGSEIAPYINFAMLTEDNRVFVEVLGEENTAAVNSFLQTYAHKDAVFVSMILPDDGAMENPET